MTKKQTIEELVKIELKDCRFHADCMSLKVKEYRKLDKWFNIILSLTSSGGITSWILNNDWGIYCGGVIAVSQLANALKPLFPFNKHVHTLNTRCYKQEAWFLELDNLWYDLKYQVIEKDAARTRLNHLKLRINENEFFDDEDEFEFSKELQDKAALMTADTLKTKYNIID